MADPPIQLGLPYPTHSKRHLHNGNDGSGVVAITSLSGELITAQIADNAVTLAKMADDAVGTAELVDNAVTQTTVPTATTSDPTTASGTYATLAEMSASLTTQASGQLLCHFDGSFYADAAAREVVVAFALDGAAEVHEVVLDLGLSITPLAAMHLFTGLSAAAHTVTVRWKRGSAAGTITNYGTRRYLLLLELKR